MLYRDVPQTPAIKEVLDDQCGVISVAQLEAVGLSASFAQERVRSGRWQRPHRGVYVVYNGELDRRTTIWAAIVRCGAGAVASHQTAAELDGLCDKAAELVHVTVGSDRQVRVRPSEGIRVHYSARLSQRRHPAKSPPRTRFEETVLDLVAASKNGQAAASWVIAAVRKRMTTTQRLVAAMANRKKMRWRRMVQAMLHDVAAGVQSMLELEHLWKVERAHGLPRGVRQRRVSHGNRVIWVDVDHDEFSLRIELDGRLGHVGEGAFRDRRRDNHATVDGKATLRYGHAEVFGTPCDVAAEEAGVLRDLGWDGTPHRCGSECTVPS